MPLSGTICQAPFSREWTAYLISIENFEAVAINLVDKKLLQRQRNLEKLLHEHPAGLLEASLNVRKSRVLTRGGSESDNETLTDNASDLLLNGYKRRMHLPVSGKVIQIDTSFLSISEVAKKIINKVINREKDFV